MSIQRSIRLSLAGAIAAALFGVCAVATAQTPSQQTTQQVPPPPPPPPTTSMPTQPAPPPPPATMPAQPTPPPPSTMPAQPAQPPPPPSTTSMPAQPAPPAQPQSAPEQAASSGQFYQGTESSATYPLPGGNGGTLTVNTGMPAHAENYGPPPSFKSLDTNHDGRISEAEARAYPPLDSDFLYASGQGKYISRAQYQKWVRNQQ